jgi:hypothetical protein
VTASDKEKKEEWWQKFKEKMIRHGPQDIYDLYHIEKWKAEEEELRLAALGMVPPKPNPTPTYETLHPDDLAAFDELYAYMKSVSEKYGNVPGEYDENNYKKTRILFDDTIEDKNKYIQQRMFYSTSMTSEYIIKEMRIRGITLRHNEAKIFTEKEFLYEEIPACLSKFGSLETISVIEPLFSNADISHFPQLKKLYLTSYPSDRFYDSEDMQKKGKINKITDLHPLIFFSNLRSLDIAGQQIKDLPDLNGDQSSKLVDLTITENDPNIELNLENLGKAANKLPNLYRLNLRENNLKNIPPGFGQLTNLMSLDLSNSPIEFIAEDLADAPKLGFLMVESEKLNAADPFFIKLIDNIFINDRIIHEMYLNAGDFRLPVKLSKETEVIERLKDTLDQAKKIAMREGKIGEKQYQRRRQYYLEEYERINRDYGYTDIYDYKKQLRIYPRRIMKALDDKRRDRFHTPIPIHPLYFKYGSKKLRTIDPYYHCFKGDCDDCIGSTHWRH